VRKKKTTWKDYCKAYSPKNKDALDAMRRVSKLFRTIVKRAIQKQKAYETTHQKTKTR